MLADLSIDDRLVRKADDAPWRADGGRRPEAIRGIPVNPTGASEYKIEFQPAEGSFEIKAQEN